jgi:hypothetical protein
MRGDGDRLKSRGRGIRQRLDLVEEPLRSHTRILSLLRRALMKANIAPESGSALITSRARIASPSICRRMSTGARCR